MTQVTDTDLKELKDLILSSREEMRSSREEMRSGFAGIDLKFANVNTQFVRLEGQIESLDTRLTGQIENLDTRLTGEIKNLDTKFTGEIKTVNASIQALDHKFDERTKNFSDRLSTKNLAVMNLVSGLTVTTVGGLLLTLYKFLFFGKI